MMKRLLMLLTCFFLSMELALAQTSTVTGVVISDEDGGPVVGASVLVKGTGLGTITDMDGKFSIQGVPRSAKTLQISYVGMQTQEVAIRQGVIRVVLETSAELIDDIVVVGYGSGRRPGSIVGSIGEIDNTKLEKIPTTNFTDALSGQISGLSVLSSSGDPTATASIRLRGISSINAGTTPLFILDGAPIESSVFNTLNPNDIENITVLKDAASTSIYGSRAANGVIVITSKKGKFDQKATVTIRGQYGFSNMVPDQLDMMNASEYLKFREMMNQPAPQAAYDAVNVYGIDTDWRKEVFSNNAPVYSLDFNVRGGGPNISYYLSFNHHDQEGIIAQSGIRRESLRFNVESRVKEWLKIGLQSNLGFNEYETNNEINASGVYPHNPAVFARMALPYDSPYYYTVDENGKVQWGDKAEYLHFTDRPTVDYVNDNRAQKRRQVTANVNLFEEIAPVRGLTLKAQQALNAFDYDLSSKNYPTDDLVTPMGDSNPGRSGSAQESFQRYYSFTYTNTAEYKFNVADDHHITVLAGQESIITKSRNFSVFVSGHTDKRQMLLTQGTTVSVDDLGHGKSESTFNSYFFTGGYNYADKYYFDASFRRDGSSKFAPDHRWSSFYSVGAMWDMKKENFLSDVKWLNELQLKASYGTSGNSSINNYMYFGLIGSGSPYNGGGTLGISQASNYDLTWETVASANVGVDFKVFDRLGIGVDFYHRKTTDMLMEIPYSYTTGYGSGYGNIGAMVNKGVDIDLNVDILNLRDFKWAFRANMNYNKNEITELFNGRDEYALPDYGLMYKVGHSSGEFYYVRRAGVDPRDGKQVWYDKDGNLTKTYNEERDAVLLGKEMYAPITGGFGTTINWRGLTVSADFSWAAKKYMISNDNYFVENPNFATGWNQTKKMLNMWTTPGQVTDVPAYTEAIQFDDHLIENASFMRLKNLTVQYSLPKVIMKHLGGVQNISLFFVGRNLWTITSYSGYDPEPDSNLVAFFYPNTRQFMFGAEISF